jgi:adenine-specific DNA-methyltransferase
MPTLNWIGKEAVVNHHHQVPFRLLKDVPELGCGEPGEGNLIVEGDNLEALKALLPYYAGQVKCIYIDPPYNTGNEGWVYNDNVRSPIIQEWLGKVVGKEGETLDRHDRWLCMMYPRLKLLREFLREDGSIWVSLDDNEIHALRYLMDEIWDEQNFIATVLWQKNFSPKNSAKHLSEDHDYVVVYAKNAESWRPNLLPRSEEALSRYKNPDNDPKGPWTSGDLQARNFYSEGTYAITCPSGRVISGPGRGMYWRYSEANFLELNRKGQIWWGPNGNNMPRLKRYLSDVKEGMTPQTLWFNKDVGHTQEAKKELLEVVTSQQSSDVFLTPKPTRLIDRILRLATKPGDLVLDSFAGSGTTGHAVLKMNAPESAQSEIPLRHFILVEMEPNIASKITAERVRRVAEGYTNAKGEKVPGLGGGFRYCRLGDPLFDSERQIRESVTFGELARHVYFTETGEPLPRERVPNTPLLGVCRGVAVYLLFNGILGDKSKNGGNILTRSILAKLPKYDGMKVIYCAGCLLGADRLASERIVVRQTPYEVKVS